MAVSLRIFGGLPSTRYLPQDDMRAELFQELHGQEADLHERPAGEDDADHSVPLAGGPREAELPRRIPGGGAPQHRG